MFDELANILALGGGLLDFIHLFTYLFVYVIFEIHSFCNTFLLFSVAWNHSCFLYIFEAFELYYLLLHFHIVLYYTV